MPRPSTKGERIKARVVRFLRKCAAFLDAVLTEILTHVRSNTGEREFDQAMQKIVHYVGVAIGFVLLIMVIILVAVVWQYLGSVFDLSCIMVADRDFNPECQ